MTPVEPHVLIIGAGVAGLTLAQGLRLRSVPFRIFERHARSHVKQGHRFRISREGLVQVRFTDGSIARGRLLVGADGIRSRVWKQLQPDRRLLDLERWVIWGRTPMTEDLKRALEPPGLMSWCMCLDHESNVQTVIESMTWSRSVRVESEGKLPEFPDYVYWVVCTASSQYAESLPTTIDEKKLYLVRVSETWHPALNDSAPHELSACVPILSSKPDIQICSTGQTGKVTLIGDSAHPMSPMGGSGGDTAIRNAADLARTIAEGGITRSSIIGFEARMEERAKEKIEHSFRGGQKFWIYQI